MISAQLINATSGCVDYFTPLEIIEAARLTMGGIDLDPASSPEANRRVRAETFYGEIMDGLSMVWRGRAWMNHPFGRRENPLWINKLEREFTAGHVTQACCITFACTSEKWFQPLLKRTQCFLSPRTNYLLPDGSVLKGVTKGSVVTYFGANVAGFARAFRGLGTIKIAI